MTSVPNPASDAAMQLFESLTDSNPDGGGWVGGWGGGGGKSSLKER
jgi:hypothetical protein